MIKDTRNASSRSLRFLIRLLKAIESIRYSFFFLPRLRFIYIYIYSLRLRGFDERFKDDATQIKCSPTREGKRERGVDSGSSRAKGHIFEARCSLILCDSAFLSHPIDHPSLLASRRLYYPATCLREFAPRVFGFRPRRDPNTPRSGIN